MNNGNHETLPADRAGFSRTSASAATADELIRLKRELLHAEVRLAKARATASGAEVDIKVLNTRLKDFVK